MHVAYDQFFLEPRDSTQCRYEALRATFVDGEPMGDVAERLHVSYGTVRNWASEFRAQMDQKQPPPFFSRRRAGGQRPMRLSQIRGPMNVPRSLMPRR